MIMNNCKSIFWQYTGYAQFCESVKHLGQRNITYDNTDNSYYSDSLSIIIQMNRPGPHFEIPADILSFTGVNGAF